MGEKNFLEGLTLIFDLIKSFQKSQNKNSIFIEKSKKFREKNDLVFSYWYLVFCLSNGLDILHIDYFINVSLKQRCMKFELLFRNDFNSFWLPNLAWLFG